MKGTHGTDALLYKPSIEDHVVDAMRVRLAQSAGRRSVEHDEGSMAEAAAAGRSELRAEQVGGQGRARCRERRVSGPFDFEEPDRDPDGELVRPDRGQVHDTLEPLRAEIRALPPVR